ncbi:MAG: protein phosphatase 2C domain-containing protein [Alphaproteobacteria bacterium]|nr:protein phosphatase 2C domain-containing protein [Alphaproteobacteria bacterium]
MIRAIGMKDKIRVLSACVRGPLHKIRNMPCQDYCKYSNKGENFVGIISDGAGSAKYGRIGAKILCDTLVDLLPNVPFSEIKPAILNSIEIAREKLQFHRLNSKNNSRGLMSFAATLVGVVYNNDKGIFFHIGDGAALAFLGGSFSKYVISKPENGAFSCETYFYTMDDWKDCIRFTFFDKAHTIMMMSDGVTGFSFLPNFTDIEPRFLLPIDNFLSKEKTKKIASRALYNTLSTDKAQKINPDDKTFLWIKL